MAFVLPDTGQEAQSRVGDDADYGFDVTEYDNSDGHAGLSYTKLDINGDPLPNDAESWEFVRDNRTELIYKMGMGTGTWADATAAAAAYGALGLTWRLPTIREWVYLADYSKNSDMFDPMVGFIDEGADPWSSTENQNDSSRVWCYEADIGYTDYACNKTDSGRHIIYVSGTQVEQSLVDNGDDTITDVNNGLMWAKYLLGGDGVAPPTQMNWNDAVDGALALELAGYTDWRLPNIKELQSIIDYSRDDPALDISFFPQIPSSAKLWSATTSSLSISNAWNVWLYFQGFTYYDSKTGSSNLYALAVRSEVDVDPVEFWRNHTLQRELLFLDKGQLEKKKTTKFIPGTPGQPYVPPTPFVPDKKVVEIKTNEVCERVI